MNDVPEDPAAVRRQRSNWFASYIEAAPYLGPLLWRSLRRGSIRSLESLFYLEFLPGCSLFFAAASAAALLLGLLCISYPGLRPWAAAVGILWTLHGAYYGAALRKVGWSLSRREMAAIPRFLRMRAAALIDGTILGLRSDPGRHTKPSAHGMQ